METFEEFCCNGRIQVNCRRSYLQPHLKRYQVKCQSGDVIEFVINSLDITTWNIPNFPREYQPRLDIPQVLVFVNAALHETVNYGQGFCEIDISYRADDNIYGLMYKLSIQHGRHQR
ncbi:MAG: hypothetical protein KME64_33510 [Scytonematopsis contorta HA4267-MV1]|nr:hypothetical protein [Scytonematopsis contorta HA4267-MV1]